MLETEPSIERPRLAACPLCSHDQLAYQFTSAGTPIVKCDCCGLLMRDPQPSDREVPPIDAPPVAFSDAVTLADRLHRRRHPLATLIDVWHRLPPGASLTARVPILDPSSARLEHLFFFDSQTLQLMLFLAGFEGVRVQAADGHLTATATRSALPPPVARSFTLTVVMPVFNERDTFSDIFESVYAKTLPRVTIDLVIVESHSTDGTRELVAAVADRPRVTVVYEDRPRGKGHAVRAGLARATGDFVLIQDADTEYDVGDYDQLVEALVAGRAAFVLGSRHGADGKGWKIRHFTDQVLVSQVMNFGHVFFTGLFNSVYGQRLRDPFTMFKVFRRDCLFGLTFESNRFDFDWELVGKLVRAGYTPLEIPVNYTSRSFSKGKKVSLWRDPWTYLRACFKYRFVRLGK
jgi:Glycosyl transferase family 2